MLTASLVTDLFAARKATTARGVEDIAQDIATKCGLTPKTARDMGIDLALFAEEGSLVPTYRRYGETYSLVYKLERHGGEPLAHFDSLHTAGLSEREAAVIALRSLS